VTVSRLETINVKALSLGDGRLLSLRLIFQELRPPSPPEKGGGIFLQLPFRYPAVRAVSERPLVSKPASRTALFGITDYHPLITMGYDLTVVSLDFKRPDTMEQSPTRRPELDLLNESEEGYLLSVIDFSWSLLCHSSYCNLCLKRQ